MSGAMSGYSAGSVEASSVPSTRSTWFELKFCGPVRNDLPAGRITSSHCTSASRMLALSTATPSPTASNPASVTSHTRQDVGAGADNGKESSKVSDRIDIEAAAPSADGPGAAAAALRRGPHVRSDASLSK